MRKKILLKNCYWSIELFAFLDSSCLIFVFFTFFSTHILKCFKTQPRRNFMPSVGFTLGKFRLVLLSNAEGVQVKFMEKLDFEEIEKTLQDEKVLGIIISKEKNSNASNPFSLRLDLSRRIISGLQSMSDDAKAQSTMFIF